MMLGSSFYMLSLAAQLVACAGLRNERSSVVGQDAMEEAADEVTTAAPVETTAAPAETTAAPAEATEAPTEEAADEVTTAVPVGTTAAPVDATDAPTEEAADEVTTAAPEDDANITFHVMILGNTGSGKSTLCQWLLADTSVCAVGAGLDSVTTVPELAKGFWFGNEALGRLEVLDTPGFHSTDNDDGGNWIETIRAGKDAFTRIDAVIFTVTDVRTAAAWNPDIINKLRLSFGTDLWQHFMVFARLPQGWWYENGAPGVKQPFFDEHIMGPWKDTFQGSEFKESVTDWSGSAAKAELESEIKGIPFQGGRLKVEPPVEPGKDFLPMIPASGPYPEIIAPKFITNRGLERLVSMKDWLEQKRANEGDWDIKDLVPRFGPSVVNPGQNFECQWPKDCNLFVNGAYLSDNDQVRIFPGDHQCGTSFDGQWDHIPVAHTISRPKFSDNSTMKQFYLGAVGSVTTVRDYKICYCEYGHCDVAARFFQEVGTLTVSPVTCQVPCPEANDPFIISNESKYCEQPTNIMYKETVLYTCKLGYGLSSAADNLAFERECEDDGDVAPAEEYCTLVRCGPPGDIYQASRTDYEPTEQNVYTKLARYGCGDGYTKDGNPLGPVYFKARCGANGDWNFPDALNDNEWAVFKEHGCRKWSVGNWSECLAECGEGVFSRSVECDPSGAVCDEASKPPTEDACKGYSGCPDCGSAPEIPHAMRFYDRDEAAPVVDTGGAPVEYVCQADAIDGQSHTITGLPGDSFKLTRFQAVCEAQLPSPAATTNEALFSFRDTASGEALDRVDFMAKGCKKWGLTDWGDCSVSCGGGYNYREVACSTGNNADCEEPPEALDLGELHGNCFLQACEDNSTLRMSQGKGGAASARAPVFLLWSLLGLLWARAGAASS